MTTYNVRSLHMFSMKYKMEKKQKKTGGSALWTSLMHVTQGVLK